MVEKYDYWYIPGRGIITEIHIADLHFGAFNPKTQYEILQEQFLSKIQDLNFDLVSIDGDLFDHKVMSNSDVVLYATLFVDNLVSLCRSKNATLILLHGTYSHDYDQLKMFYHYMDDKTVDVRVITQIPISSFALIDFIVSITSRYSKFLTLGSKLLNFLYSLFS